MPKVIVANVDSDAMCGNDMEPEIHALSSLCCCRLIVLAEDEDLVVVPHSLSDAFIDYVNELLGRNLSGYNAVVPRDGDSKLLILNDESLNDGHVAAQIRERAGVGPGEPLPAGWELEAYFLDRAVIALADDLQVPLYGLDPVFDRTTRGFLRSGGAETFNSKVLFRQLAEAVGAPVPAGRVATSARELGRAIADLIGATGRVMIKQDRNSGSAGNTVITTFGETTLTGGSRTQPVSPDTDFHALAAELWPGMRIQRNTQVVVEAYHKPAEVYYSELWVPGADGSPQLLNFGEMRMEPTFIGFEIPSQRMSQFDIGDMAAHSMNLAREAGRRGFYGYMNIDSIISESGRLFFNEVNGRMGDCTHVDYLARQLVGDDYGRTRVVLTYNWVESGEFAAVLKSLDEAGVLFDKDSRTGVLLPIEDVERTGVVDYMVIGTDLEQALDLERRALAAIQAA
jgi:hypothetical protein